MGFHIPSQGNRQLQGCRDAGGTAALLGEAIPQRARPLGRRFCTLSFRTVLGSPGPPSSGAPQGEAQTVWKGEGRLSVCRLLGGRARPPPHPGVGDMALWTGTGVTS